jgi:DNA (cytosine-5)-methyltransferase 1
MGWENVFHCEWMEFPRKVLDYYFPNADSHIDICKTDFKKYANTIDILTGGFPCQPFSTAGKRKGTDDERYLWGEMLRAIQEIKPKYVIAENVFGITNIDGGLVFEQVCLDLEAEGYEVQPFIIPAAAKNAPHRRDRVWFVAFNAKSTRNTEVRAICEGSHNESIGICEKDRVATNTNSDGLNQCNSNDEINTSKGGKYALSNISKSNDNGDASDTYCWGLEGTKKIRRDSINVERKSEFGIATDTTSTRGGQDNRIRKSRFYDKKSSTNNWSDFPTQSPICGGDDGLPSKLDGITFSKWRAESIKGYGNAIVPQVAYEIFKQL